MQEGNLDHTQIDQGSKVSAALLVGFAAGLQNCDMVRQEWKQDEKLELSSCVELAKLMLWEGEPTTWCDRSRVLGLQDDLMIGLVTGDDVYEAIVDMDGDDD